MLVSAGAVFAAGYALAVDVHSVPTGGVHLQLTSRPTLAPVVGPDGATMVGPDGRERCVAIAEPPAALAAQPDAVPGLAETDNVPTGVAVTVADRPLTLADTVPC